MRTELEDRPMKNLLIEDEECCENDCGSIAMERGIARSGKSTENGGYGHHEKEATSQPRLRKSGFEYFITELHFGEKGILG